MIVDFLAVLLEIIKVLFAICATTKGKRQLINLLYRTAGKENERKNIADFYSYINPRFNSTSLDSTQVSDYKIKRLKEELKPNASCNQMTFILGDPGSGKSTLMLHLAYWYCRYNRMRKEISFNENLKNWGILYCRMRDYQSLEALKEKFEDDIEAVFLDGFDEFVVLQDKPEESVLEELLVMLLDKSNVFRKIYISSRKEPFKSDLKTILEKRNLDGHQPQIIEICPFDRKQILSLYKKKGKTRNVCKMRRYLSDNETIFRIPLFIEYADVIIKDYSDQVSPSLWQALNSIVNDWMEKEEQFWYSRQEV